MDRKNCMPLAIAQHLLSLIYLTTQLSFDLWKILNVEKLS